MEDRETKHIAQTVVDTFWDPVPIGALEQAKALSKCIFAFTVRRVFRSHPVLWQHLFPRLQTGMSKYTSVKNFDVLLIESMVR